MTSPWYKSLIENGKLAEDLEKPSINQRRRRFRKNTKITKRGKDYHRLYVYVPIDTFEKMKKHCHRQQVSFSTYVTSILNAIYHDKVMMRKYAQWRREWIKQHGPKDK